jgi:hypothetical protein
MHVTPPCTQVRIGTRRARVFPSAIFRPVHATLCTTTGQRFFTILWFACAELNPHLQSYPSHWDLGEGPIGAEKLHLVLRKQLEEERLRPVDRPV